VDVSFNLSYLRYCHHLLLYIRVIKKKKKMKPEMERRTERREVGRRKRNEMDDGKNK
jgi:hypothetical protein